MPLLFTPRYTREGNGDELAREPQKGVRLFFWLYFSNFGRLFLLNLLILFSSLPVLTIPAALSAAAYVLRNIREKKPFFLWSDFWHQFAINFFAAWRFTGCILLPAAACFAGLWYFGGQSAKAAVCYAPLALCIISLYILLPMLAYGYLMVATVKMDTRTILKNAFLLAFIGWRRNLVSLLFVGLLAGLLVLFFPLTMVLMALGAFSLMGYIVVYNLYGVIKEYILEPYDRERAESPQ
jgi:uncharacterized membrane protein YesL